MSLFLIVFLTLLVIALAWIIGRDGHTIDRLRRRNEVLEYTVNAFEIYRQKRLLAEQRPPKKERPYLAGADTEAPEFKALIKDLERVGYTVAFTAHPAAKPEPEPPEPEPPEPEPEPEPELPEPVHTEAPVKQSQTRQKRQRKGKK